MEVFSETIAKPALDPPPQLLTRLSFQCTFSKFSDLLICTSTRLLTSCPYSLQKLLSYSEIWMRRKRATQLQLDPNDQIHHGVSLTQHMIKIIHQSKCCPAFFCTMHSNHPGHVSQKDRIVTLICDKM